MKIIIQERATGKTTELIKMSAKTGDTIVCIHWAAEPNKTYFVIKHGKKLDFSHFN